jgi:predicted Fe-Mo cluster-binding NifX family protein
LRIAVSATDGNLDAQIDPRFGRCQYFVFVDSDTMQFTARPNASTGAMHGAGIEAAQTVANEGAKAVITGSVGPNAFQVLSQAGIEVITDASGTVRETIQRYKTGQLGRPTTGATVPGHAGLGVGPAAGPGMGFGRGMGMGGGGRGMGMGRGRGMGMVGPYAQPPYFPPTAPMPAMSREQEIQMLESQRGYLQGELDRIKKRMSELKE